MADSAFLQSRRRTRCRFSNTFTRISHRLHQPPQQYLVRGGLLSSQPPAMALVYCVDWSLSLSGSIRRICFSSCQRRSSCTHSFWG